MLVKSVPELLAHAGSAAFSLIVDSLAFQFAFFGMKRAAARGLARRACGAKGSPGRAVGAVMMPTDLAVQGPLSRTTLTAYTGDGRVLDQEVVYL
jgi:hypothetical protein